MFCDECKINNNNENYIRFTYKIQKEMNLEKKRIEFPDPIGRKYCYKRNYPDF